jgi:predicted SAM-dependent methyltransferase
MNATIENEMAHTQGIPELEEVKLNIGAGPVHLDGYINLDRKTGQEAFPLQYADGSVDEIRASHVLEHFSHREIDAVLAHWVAKLRPGGVLKIAVPDFKKVAKEYLRGNPINVQGYVMGGHTDRDDHHGVIFDRETLEEAFYKLGLTNITTWESDAEDCSRLDISLNIRGTKLHPGIPDVSGTHMLLASARFGPAMHHRCTYEVVNALKLTYNSYASCFWFEALSNLIEGALKNPACKYILTADYDSMFTVNDVLELHRLAEAYPEAKAIVPVQSKRQSDSALFTICDDDGNLKRTAYAQDFAKNLTRITTGHFGLTLINADCLRALPRPWMQPTPNSEGRWDDGQTDADISFWRNWHDAGHKVFLANNVRIGHMQELVTWPGYGFKPIHQTLGDYQRYGMPPEVAAQC